MAALLAWLDPDRLTKRLEDEIDELGEPDNPLTAKEKEKRLAELTARMDELERAEESLIEAGHDSRAWTSRAAPTLPPLQC